MIKKSGFTFMELLVVLMAIAFFSTLTVPVLFEIHVRSKFYLAVAELKGALLRAQANAIVTRKVMVVHVGASSSSHTATSFSWMPTEHVSLKGAAFTVYFGPRGQPQVSLSDSTPLGVVNIKVCENENKANAHSRIITINRMGHISEGPLVEGCS